MIRLGRSRSAWMLLALGAAVALVETVALAQSRDDTIVDIRVDAGPRPRIPAAQVLNTSGLHKGQAYDKDALLKAIRNLENTKWFYTVNTKEERTRDGIVIHFIVTERRVIEDVLYHGSKSLTRKELDAATGLRRSMPMHPALSHTAKEAILFELHKKGRFLAEVRILEGSDPDDRRVVFDITEGPIVRIRDIQIEGNSGELASNARLKVVVNSKERFLGVIGGKFHPEMIEEDRQKLIEYYRNFGYYDVKIHREIRWNPGHDSVDVVYVVEEGKRLQVKDVEVVGAKAVDKDILLAHNEVKKGEYYNAKDANKSVRAMQQEYGRRGYANARVSKSVNFRESGDDMLTVVYNVEREHAQPFSIGEIRVHGNTVTDQRVIVRELLYAGVVPSQLLDSTAVARAEARLRALSIFKFDPANGIMPTVEVLDPDSPNPQKDLQVWVTEGETGMIQFGVGITSDAGANASIVLHERNFDILNPPRSWDDVLNKRAFRGAGQEFRMEVQPGTEYSRYIVSWRDPYIFDTPYSLGLSAYYFTRRYDGYDDQRLGGRISVGRRFTPEWSAELSSRIENVKIFDVHPFAPPEISDFGGSHLVAAPRVSAIRDTTDFFLRPTQGNKLKLSYEHAFGDYTYPTLSIEDTQYFTLLERADGSGRHVLMLRGQAAATSDDAPIYDRLFAGGINSIRGFDFRGVGPRKNGFPIGGNFMMTGTVEYQFPILASDALYGVVFSDFGTVEDDVAIRDMRVSAGFGFRINIPAFGPAPIALDFGFPIRKTDFDDRQVFSFYIGFNR